MNVRYSWSRVVFGIAVFLNYSVAGAETTDSLSHATERVDSTFYRFDPKQLIVPGVLVAVGAFGVGNGWMKHLKRDLHNDMVHLSGGHHFRADNYLQYLPAASYLGLGAVGVEGRHRFADRAIIAATSFVAMCAIVQPIKHIVHEPRPDGSGENDAFPSGHTATAFMGAELVRSEYSLPIGVAAYATACGIGFFRLYNDRHWFNDVIAGAGIGILSARIGIWMLPVWKRLFGRVNHSTETVIAFMPSYDPAASRVGISGIIRF